MQYTDDLDDMVLSEEETQLRKEAVAWVIRLQNDGLSRDDRQAFDVWKARSPSHARMFQQVLGVWNSPELGAAATVAARAVPASLPVKSIRHRRWLILAAACAGLFMIATVQWDLLTRWQADYQAGTGERRTVELPDRSIAILNTQSAIALSFDGKVRRIRLLKGEAFFSVRHDSDRPFIVESDDTAVRAVGTAFFVRVKSGADQVTVLEGVVEAGGRGTTDSTAIVTAGSRIDMEQGHPGRPYAVDEQATSAWLKGRLVVQGVPFAQVLEELGRYYPGMIVLWNQHAGETKVTGTYNVDDPAAALTLLIKTVPVSVIGWTDRLVILF